MRRLQFISNKDQSLFLKYNQILQALQTPNQELFDKLSQNRLDLKDLYEIGVCLCDQDWQGFKCQTPVINDKPNQCHPNSTVPSCNPLTSICQPSEFLLRNNLQNPNDRLNEYRSYYCECTKEGVIGVNCEYQKNQCDSLQSRLKRQQIAPFLSDPVRRYQASTLGSINNNTGKCDPKKDEFCYPVSNSTDKYICLGGVNNDQQAQKNSTPIVNYLIFDESNRNPKFKDDPNRPNDSYKRLNLSDASVVVGIQNFIRDEVMPRYAYNNYAKIPKGPLALLRPSIDIPGVINSVRDRVNTFIAQNDTRASNALDKLTSNRIQQLVQDTLLNLIANQQLGDKLVLNNLNSTIDKLIDKLNLSHYKNYSTQFLNLKPQNYDPKLNQSSGLVEHLDALLKNSQKLDKPEYLRDILSLTANNEPYLDLFNFSNRPYSLVKLDVLPGIYVDPDGELSLRPTPGIYLESLPADKNDTSDRELIFLPGIFNPASSPDCSIKTIFTPGVMSLPIDNYDLNNLPNDANKYLNKFVPMQLPFNINGFLTPLRSSQTDTISALLSQPDDPTTDNLDIKSHLILTPLDINPDSSLDLMTKNEKFMKNLFSTNWLDKLMNEQKQLDTLNLASTLILSDPTMLPLSKQNILNTGCLPNGTSLNPRYNPRGAQFYNPSYPIQNVTVLPYIFYDENGEPIPSSIVEESIAKYCRNYQVQMNEFHARICEAQAQTNMLKDVNRNDSNICQNCPFTGFVDRYYNPLNLTSTRAQIGINNDGKKAPKKINRRNLAILILACILGIFMLK